MVDIPEHLLLKTAEARAKALGISVEQALAEMRGEVKPTKIEKEPDIIEVSPVEVEVKKEAPVPATEGPVAFAGASSSMLFPLKGLTSLYFIIALQVHHLQKLLLYHLNLQIFFL